MNLYNDQLIYSHAVEIINSSYQSDNMKDLKKLFKSERGIDMTTYELLKLFSFIATKEGREQHSTYSSPLDRLENRPGFFK